MCPTHISTLLSETFTIIPTNSGQPGIIDIPGQDVRGQCDDVKTFNGVDGYVNNRLKIKEKEDEKKEKEKSRDKKKKDKESSKEEMEGLSDNGGVFDFLKSVLHLNPKSRHCIEDVQKFALFQPFHSSSSSSPATSCSTSTSSSTLYKAFLTPQASPFSFSFLFLFLFLLSFSFSPLFSFLFPFYIQIKNDTFLFSNQSAFIILTVKRTYFYLSGTVKCYEIVN